MATVKRSAFGDDDVETRLYTRPTEGRTGAPRADSSPLHRGTEIGRYLILGYLGEGGMGVVYEAFDPTLHRHVALKLVRAPDDKSRSRRRARLLREAQALARVSHPNVITVYDVGIHGEHVFIAMELVEGVTLTEWLHESPRTPQEIAHVFAAAGRGLAAAHRVGLVHRDFKPSNVMVDDRGRVRVLDFGLVCALDADPDGCPTVVVPGESVRDTEVSFRAITGGDGVVMLDNPLTRVGSVVGTPAYMAPEQHLGHMVDERTDQFGFCVALYAALYGQKPFASEDSGELRALVLSGSLMPPPAGSRVPSRFTALLARGLAIHPDDRYPSMDALLVDLRRASTPRRSRLLAAVGVVLVLVLVALVGAMSDGSVEGQPCVGPGCDEDLAVLIDPPSEALAVRAATIRGRLGVVAYLLKHGRWRDGLPIARALARDAAGSGAPLEAEVLLALGKLEAGMSELDAAEATLYQAAERAASAGSDRVVAAAVIEQVRVLGERPERVAEALTFARSARVAIARVGDEPLLRVSLAGVLAAIYNESNSPDEARRVLGAAPLHNRPRSREVVAAHIELARAAMATRDFTRALSHLDDALSLAEMWSEHPIFARLSFERARAFVELGHHGEAAAALARARDIYARTTGVEHPDAIATSLLWARILSRHGAVRPVGRSR